MTARVWAAPLAGSRFARAGKGIYVSSPELCFVQMARELSIYELIQLGYELCGIYLPPRPGSDILGSRPHALTSPQAIMAMANRLQGTHGRTDALRAARYIQGGARSPMETVLGMLLNLPRLLGGKGIPGMSLDHRIDLDEHARKLARRSYLVCDLYWEKARLDVEYEGRAFHEGEAGMASDKSRSNALSHMGVDVMSVFDEHIRSDEALQVVALEIAKKVGFRMRPRSYDDATKTRELRQAILCRPGGAKPAWPGMRVDAPLLAQSF